MSEKKYFHSALLDLIILCQTLRLCIELLQQHPFIVTISFALADSIICFVVSGSLAVRANSITNRFECSVRIRHELRSQSCPLSSVALPAATLQARDASPGQLLLVSPDAARCSQTAAPSSSSTLAVGFAKSLLGVRLLSRLRTMAKSWRQPFS